MTSRHVIISDSSAFRFRLESCTHTIVRYVVHLYSHIVHMYYCTVHMYCSSCVLQNDLSFPQGCLSLSIFKNRDQNHVREIQLKKLSSFCLCPHSDVLTAKYSVRSVGRIKLRFSRFFLVSCFGVAGNTPQYAIRNTQYIKWKRLFDSSFAL